MRQPSREKAVASAAALHSRLCLQQGDRVTCSCRLLRAVHAATANSLRKTCRPTSPTPLLTEPLEDRRLLSVSITTPYDCLVEGYSSAFVADFTSNVRPTSASVAWGDGTTDQLDATMMDYDSTTGAGRLYGIHDFSSPGDWNVTFTVQHDGESASETYLAPIGGGDGTEGASAASNDFGAGDALVSDGTSSGAAESTSVTAAAVSTGSIVNALDLTGVKVSLNRTATNPGRLPSAYSVETDVNADGQINALDMGLVKAHLNTRLPDGQPASAAALPDAAGPFNAVAQISQVFINGAGLTGQTTANGVAFRNLGGVDNTFGYPVPAGGRQNNSIPWSGGVNKISLRFTQDMAAQLQQQDLVVHGINTANYAISGFSYDPAVKTGTWTLATAITRDKVMLIMDDANVGGLDGEWTNPSDTTPVGDQYPSGNDINGGDFKFLLNVLVGDVRQGAAPPAIDLDVATISHNTMTGVLTEADEDAADKGAFVPVNTDDDDYDQDNKADFDQTGAIDGETDLLPIVLRRNVDAAGAGYFWLTIPSNLRVWQNDDRTGLVDVSTNIPAAADTTLYVEAIDISPNGSELISINWTDGTKSLNDADQVRITAYSWSGAA
jgi:hypothetical protein